jgi:hypothetical protein
MSEFEAMATGRQQLVAVMLRGVASPEQGRKLQRVRDLQEALLDCPEILRQCVFGSVLPNVQQ